MKYLGVAYYPEFWGIERVTIDAKLMQDAGINIARIGEFAWSRMEPEEGKFTLDWLHETAEILDKHKINILMCTPGATPPAWLTSAYPDVLLVNAIPANGSYNNDHTIRRSHGNRRHYCSTSDAYRRHITRIDEELSRQMSQHKNVVAWQIDNELGNEAGWCHCENCQARFQNWLQRKYGTLEELNRAWATGFWSMDYSDWRQVRLGEDGFNHYSSRVLDSKRFFSQMMSEYGWFQAAILRKNHPGALVTTNGMGPIYNPIDYYKLFDKLDVACDDLYFDIGTMDTDAAAMNVFRSIKPGKRYWITETGSGALDHNRPPHPGQFRAWAWSSWAHGADGHFVFRWRTCLSGQEQELQGILEHSGEPRHRYQQVKECFTEFARLQDVLKDAPLPAVSTAIVQDYNVLWGYEASRVGPSVKYLEHLYALHKKLYQRNIIADIISPEQNLENYKLIILPTLMMISEGFAYRLQKAVKKGAVVLATGQIGMRDFNDNYLPIPAPQHLDDLLGVSIYGGMYTDSQIEPDEALWTPTHKHGSFTVPVEGELNGKEVKGTAWGWVADAELKIPESQTVPGGQALLSFTADIYAGQPALVENKSGKGKAIYMGTLNLDDALFEQVIDYVLTQAGIPQGDPADGISTNPLYVEVVQRGPFTVAVNHTAKPVSVKLTNPGKVILGEVTEGYAELPPFGVCVIKS